MRRLGILWATRRGKTIRLPDDYIEWRCLRLVQLRRRAADHGWSVVDIDLAASGSLYVYLVAPDLRDEVCVRISDHRNRGSWHPQTWSLHFGTSWNRYGRQLIGFLANYGKRTTRRKLPERIGTVQPERPSDLPPAACTPILRPSVSIP